jgi:hypothetical protein
VIHPPEELLGATDFRDDKLRDASWLIELVKQTGYVLELLEAAQASLDKGWGRRRDPGLWPLMLLAFSMSDSVDLRPWHDATTPELWRTAGFLGKPPYGTVYDRFVEMEQIWQQIEAAAGRLIQQGKRHDPRVGQDLHIDSTEAETNAAVVHDYANCDACPSWVREQARTKQAAAEAARITANENRAAGIQESPQESRKRRRERNRAIRRRPVGERPARASSEEAKTVRQAENTLPVEEVETVREDQVESLGVSADGVLRFRNRKTGHVYRLADATAGVRAYQTADGDLKKYWPGFLNTKAVCHFVKAPTVVRVYAASRNEHDIYDEMLNASIAQMGGELPEAVVADRGFSHQKVFRRNTELGIASVIDWRAVNASDYRRDHESHDRHGIKRCDHCGGPTKFVRFHTNNGKPRLWVKCAGGVATPGCAKVQTISCSRDWKLLLPLWRTDVIYFELKTSHNAMEAVHGYWRSRYNVAPNCFKMRPKRTGVAWQQLRASAALLVEWMRICYRAGWLGTARVVQRARRAAERRTLGRACRFSELGQEALDGLRASRRATGLSEPYGPQAATLANDETLRLPPSERPGATRRGSELSRRRAQNERRRARARGSGSQPRNRGSG